MEYEHVSQSARSARHTSTSTIPSQDLNVQYTKRVQHPHHIPHHHSQHHLTVNNAMPRPHHPQAVYLSPNPSVGSQAPPMYYAPPNAYPHTPNSMVHREIDEDYDTSSGTDGMNGEPNPYHRMQMQQPKYAPQQYHSHGAAGPYTHTSGDHVTYYSPSLPTPAVSPASSCSGPNNLPPPTQYTTQSTTASGHHSPPSTQASQHQPTPYQQASHTPNPQHPQPIHYAAAYSGHNRLYATGINNEISDVPRLHQHNYPSSQNMPLGSEGNHGLGINMNQPMKVEVSTPMSAAW